MAIRTQRLVGFEDEAIVLSFDYDDATGNVVLVRCVNTSPTYGVHALIQGTGTGPAGRSREGTFGANSGTTEIAIPGGQQPRYPVGPVDEEGVPGLDGYVFTAETLV